LIPRLKPYFNYQEILAALRPSTGNILKFERAFSAKFGCEHGVMFSYGRTALYALLKVWGLEKDEVICPAYTCVVVQHSIVLSGNTPVFVDCEEGSFNMSYQGIADAVTDKTRAIVVTHLFGYPMDVHEIRRIISEAEDRFGHKIYIIQDAAHSYGAKWKGELVTGFGDAAIFGLNISKIINSIFGGMTITSSQDTYNKLLQFRREHIKKAGIIKPITRFAYLVSSYIAFNKLVYNVTNLMARAGVFGKLIKYYDEASIDFPDGWDIMPIELEARVGLKQLSKYDEIIKKRTASAKNYLTKFQNEPEFKLPEQIDGATYSHFVIIVEDRDKWVEKYRRKGIQLGILIEYSVPEMPVYQAYRKGSYPISKYYAEHCINIPNWPGINLMAEDGT
jgi:dTDP-4-amino-4,6-dideoxygalactose transaminase